MSERYERYPVQPDFQSSLENPNDQWVEMDLGEFATFMASQLTDYQVSQGWDQSQIDDFNNADRLLTERVALQYSAALGDQEARDKLNDADYARNISAAESKTASVWDQVINKAQWSDFWQNAEQRMQQELIDANSEWELSADGRWVKKKKKNNLVTFVPTTPKRSRPRMPMAA